jgi:hypothetical protein
MAALIEKIKEGTAELANETSRLVETKPITPEMHGAIDYPHAALNLAAPLVFGLTGVAALATALWGMTGAIMNPLTNHRYALKRTLPFSTHGKIEKWSGLALLGLVALAGGLRRKRNRNYLLPYAAAEFLIYNLTDWKARPKR